MSDLMSAGMAWLESRRHEVMSSEVTYSRGQASTTLQATIGKSVFEQTNDYGAMQRVETVDFIVRPEDLDLGSGSTLPRSGDRVIGVDGAIYEVQSVPGEPVWRYTDQYRNAVRVHAKAVS